jgi:hypothetical protein
MFGESSLDDALLFFVTSAQRKILAKSCGRMSTSQKYFVPCNMSSIQEFCVILYTARQSGWRKQSYTI